MQNYNSQESLLTISNLIKLNFKMLKTLLILCLRSTKPHISKKKWLINMSEKQQNQPWRGLNNGRWAHFRRNGNLDHWARIFDLKNEEWGILKLLQNLLDISLVRSNLLRKHDRDDTFPYCILASCIIPGFDLVAVSCSPKYSSTQTGKGRMAQ